MRADVYLEGRDQYNGWFYSSLMTHVAMGNKTAPFKLLYPHGFVLDGKGQKMSKSMGNVVDPVLLTDGYKVCGLGSLEMGLVSGWDWESLSVGMKISQI